MFIKATLRRSNEPVTISHLQLKCSIQLIEYMATVNYFVTANWYSLGSCCCGPINTTLPYKFLFLQWILFRWHIYIVSSINVCVNKYLCFFFCSVCIIVQMLGVLAIRKTLLYWVSYWSTKFSSYFHNTEN